jgi:L-malate glycosyltransferase
MRILVAGWVNSPHVTAWAAMLVELDHEVSLVGHLAPGWPPARPPEGIAACQELTLGRTPLLKSLQLGRDLRRAARRLRPDLVHAHWLPEYGWLAARAGLHPLVSSAWGSDVLGAGLLGRRRSGVAIRGADLVLADSTALAKGARRLVPDGPPVEVFHPGVDLDRFGPADRDEARRSLGWRAGIPIVLSTRSLSPLYNPLTVIRAFARVQSTNPEARLVLKHPTDSVPSDVLDSIRRAGLTDNVDIIGHVDLAIMPKLYQAADLVISVPSSDSSPATAWEALACRRPLVVSDLPWARSELRHREMAWITPIDSDNVAEAIRVLLADQQLATELGTRGRALAETTMDRRERVRALDQRYRALVGRPAGNRESGTR